MKLTVIGAGAAVPRPGGACSGYLVEDGDTRILLDCGSGVYSRLQQVVDPFSLAAVFISHLHPDHFLDLIPFRYALRYALGSRPPEPPQLWLPPGAIETLEKFAVSFGAAADFFAEVFALREYDPADRVQVGALVVSFQQVRHYVTSFGMRVGGERTLAYSADAAFGDEVVGLAAGADLFLCEATAQESTIEQVKGGHLSAAQAGELATRAGVPVLVLTHIWHELDPLVSLNEARATYAGRLDYAVEGRSYAISPGERMDGAAAQPGR